MSFYQKKNGMGCIYTLPGLYYILYNYRLLMRCTREHKDHVRYWLTKARGRSQPIPDKVFMVTRKLKSKVYYLLLNCQDFFQQSKTFMNNTKELFCLTVLV